MRLTDERLLLLSPDDNLLVLKRSIGKGETLKIEGFGVSIPINLALGHKLARHEIKKGDAILKYGVAIGTATEEIARGAHVHTHNIESNYTKTHTLYDAQENYGESS